MKIDTYYDEIGRKIFNESVDAMEPILKRKLKVIDIKENIDEPGLVYIVVYAHDIHFMSDHEVEILCAWLKQTLDKLNRSMSIGKYTYHCSAKDPANYANKNA